MVKYADEVLIEVSSGKGGIGCISFRREKYVPKGGPAGGDGGRGGDVVFRVRRNLRTLAHLRYAKRYAAKPGQDGMGSNKHGANGEDMVIELPPGSTVKDAETGEVLRDFTLGDEPWVYLRGGNGGWGNTHYKSSVNQAPRFAQPGQPAISAKVRIELSIIADIGLLGEAEVPDVDRIERSAEDDRFQGSPPPSSRASERTTKPKKAFLTSSKPSFVQTDIGMQRSPGRERESSSKRSRAPSRSILVPMTILGLAAVSALKLSSSARRTGKAPRAPSSEQSMRNASALARDMCLRKRMPRPAPSWAPSMIPGMSAITRSRSKAERTPRLGILVVKG